MFKLLVAVILVCLLALAVRTAWLGEPPPQPAAEVAPPTDALLAPRAADTASWPEHDSPEDGVRLRLPPGWVARRYANISGLSFHPDAAEPVEYGRVLADTPSRRSFTPRSKKLLRGGRDADEDAAQFEDLARRYREGITLGYQRHAIAGVAGFWEVMHPHTTAGPDRTGFLMHWDGCRAFGDEPFQTLCVRAESSMPADRFAELAPLFMGIFDSIRLVALPRTPE